ncbi:type I-E CRISPR-associated protein Cas7/Cse4/CasC [Deinococcus sp. YIM 77859]|uniref:type I-E CRISPR-associated protein Cas7/Cse4/CasC n=1 Tax=Deinococcus sp. YIM 77859 TaxID=1540221 RepID=UPI000556AD4F|nr:type I-E CRISPR-associated protein Cas7/Cse4/CasC [Deinococcus sp. YIM 77859]
MKALLELHILQNFAPSNLNRDDTGSPKDAYFGGVRRARISSQSFKRAMRLYFREQQLLNPDELGERTKRAHEAIRDLLVQRGRGRDEAEAAAMAALGGLGLPVKDGKSQYLLFLGRDELERVAGIIEAHWDDFAALTPAADEGKKKAKGSKKAELPGDIGRQLANALNGTKAVDVALFGRMLADLPDKNTDAAAQVAHALGTHAANREFDFYTAVDDLKPEDNAGADMLGTVEFGSATFYRYAAVDLAKLLENLGGDADLALRGLRAFLTAAVYALPGGKQNTFAAHNPPSLFATVVREDASPRNLANAFEVPVRPGQGGIVENSMKALAAEWDRQERIFGQAGRGRYVNARDERDLEALPGERFPDIAGLLDATLADVEHLLDGLR